MFTDDDYHKNELIARSKASNRSLFEHVKRTVKPAMRTRWEKKFLAGVAKWLKDHESLSDRQRAVLLNMVKRTTQTQKN
jgi:hypothetical protein